MPKVYFHVDAEFTIELSDRTAQEFVEKFDANRSFLDLDLDYVPPPYGAPVAFSLYKENLVSGEFTAQKLRQHSVLICMRGIFVIEPRSTYVDMALAADVLWIVPVDEAKYGIKVVEYKDYYGMHTKKCLDVIVSRSLKELRKASETTTAALRSAASPEAVSYDDAVSAIKKPNKSLPVDKADVVIRHTLEVSGEFFYLCFVEIPAKDARRLMAKTLSVSNYYNKVIQASDFQSCYGAKFPLILVDGKPVMEVADLEQFANVETKKLFNLDEEGEKYFFIFREVWEPPSLIEIAEPFNSEKLQVHRAALVAGNEEIGDVLVINYDKKLDFDTGEGKLDGIWICHGGFLTNLQPE